MKKTIKKRSEQLNLFNDPNNHGSGPEEFSTCESCNKIFNKKDMLDTKLCEKCYENNFSTCESCDKIFNKKDMLEEFCNSCGVKCYNCARVINKDEVAYADDDGDDYCLDCYNEIFSQCEYCSKQIRTEDIVYQDDSAYCHRCFDRNFGQCEDCENTFSKFDLNSDYLCEQCAESLEAENNTVEKRYEGDIDLTEFSYTKKDKQLDKLIKLLPISIKDLKVKHVELFSSLGDLIKFSGGKDLTLEIVAAYRDSLIPERFPVEYTLYDGDAQRSVKKDKPQLVINILLSDYLLKEVAKNPVIQDLFTQVNEISEKSGHPSVPNQIGWARIEIDPNRKYLLVDEIQSDHSNSSHNLILKSKKDNIIGHCFDCSASSDSELCYSCEKKRKIRDGLKKKNNIDDDTLNENLLQYGKMLKDFPNIAMKSISEYAKKHNIGKIYWHTYEGGKSLKGNEPPKSLYTTLPKDHGFNESENSPFNLGRGLFFERQANKISNILLKKADLFYKMAMAMDINQLSRKDINRLLEDPGTNN